MRNQYCWPLLIAFSVVVPPATADEELFFDELPMVASVSRLPQRQADAPASVTVIDREMIKASGARALNDVMRLVPGFQTFAHSDASARVNYHGITDDNDFSPRVQVLVDGRSLHSPLFRSGMNWSLVPVALEDIERIEVVRGSNTVSFGTNAFLGVINIITVNPALVRGTSVAINNGNQGVRDYTLRSGGKFGENGNYRFTLQEVKDDGLDDSYNWSDSFRNQRFDARFDYQLNTQDLLELHVGKIEGKFTKGRLELPGRTPPGVPRIPLPFSDPEDPIRDQHEYSTWMQARWTRVLGPDADFSLRYAFNKDKSNDAFTNPGFAVGFQRQNASGDWGRRSELEAVYTFSPMKQTRLVTGASWRRDDVTSATVMRGEGKVTREVWRAFANGEWRPLTWLTGNFGVSNEYDSLAGNHVSPRASVSLHFNPENTVRLGYSQAWRTGSIRAYYANYQEGPTIAETEQGANPNLPAERLDSWELAYLADWRGLRMSLDVRQFREKVSDRMISLRPAASNLQPRSEQPIQDINIDGYELQWKWRPFDPTQIILAHASMRIDSDFTATGEQIALTPGSNLSTPAGIEDYTVLAEDSAPRRSTSILWMQKLPFGAEFSLARYWVDAVKWTRNTEVGKYHRTDARLGYPFNVGGQRGEIAYTVQSLNGAHVEQRDVTDPREQSQRTVDRRHWVSLRLDF
jgi:iron complex outermembrane recepter protein